MPMSPVCNAMLLGHSGAHAGQWIQFLYGNLLTVFAASIWNHHTTHALCNTCLKTVVIGINLPLIIVVVARHSSRIQLIYFL